MRLNGYITGYTDLIGDLQHGGSHSGAAESDIVRDASGQMHLAAFGGSGQLEYRLGPYEGWAAKTSTPPGGSPAGDGFWPIPHSGNVLNDIGQSTILLTSLEEMYQNGPDLFIFSGGDSLNINLGDAKFRLAGTGGTGSTRYPNLSLSGELTLPTSVHDTGDINFVTHADTRDNGPSPATQGEAAALALGFGSLNYNSGSGMVNLVPGSGIHVYGGSSVSSPPPFTSTSFDLTIFGSLIPDECMDVHQASLPSDSITVHMPGLYLCGYSVLMNRQGGSTDRVISRIKLTRNGSQIRGSRAYGYQRSGSVGEASIENQFLFTAEAGDVITLEWDRVAGPAALPTDIVWVPGQSVIWFWRIGPHRTKQSSK